MCENMGKNKKDKKHKEDEIRKLIKIGWLSALGVLGVWSLTFFLLFIPGSDRQGQFGDLFGAVNALFSGLAFAGLIITLILQRKELALQRDELKDNRTEMERQTTQFKEQNKIIWRFNALKICSTICSTFSKKLLMGCGMIITKKRM